MSPSMTKKQQEKQIADQMKAQSVLQQFSQAQALRSPWEQHWKQAYDYTIPQRSVFSGHFANGSSRVDNLFDATAADAAEQLAASLLAQLTPPWSQWVGLKTGPALNDGEVEQIAPIIEDMTQTIREQFDRSNFAVEMHQCYLDLVVGGTACLLFEETKPGAYSAFKFTAIPLSEVFLNEGDDGRLDTTFRCSEIVFDDMAARFPSVKTMTHFSSRAKRDADKKFKIIEAVMPEKNGYLYNAVMVDEGREAILLKENCRF